MPHEVPFEDLVDLVEGSLAPDEAARLEAHIAGCAECAADAAWLRRVAGLMASDRLVDAPAELVTRVQGLYRAPRRRPLLTLADLFRALYAPGLRRVGAVALTVLLLTGTLWAWGNAPVAQAATLAMASGRVEVQLPGSAQWQPAAVGLRLEAGYALRSGAGATAVLQYADGSRTTLAEGAEVRILAIDGRRDGRTSNVRLSQQAGHTQHEVGSAHSAIQVETAAAVARASEATYDVWVDGGETDVVAGKGKVGLSAGHSKANLTAGEHGRAAKGEVKVEPSAPTPTSGEGYPIPQPNKPQPAGTPKPGHDREVTPTPDVRPSKEHAPQGKATPGPDRPEAKPKATKTPHSWFWPWSRQGQAGTSTVD